MGFQFGTLEEQMKNLWPTNKIYNSSSRSELALHAGYNLHRPERRHRKGHKRPSTKRQLLQATSRFYHPMGLMSVLIAGKLIFQNPGVEV
jgi:hypothetical protein